MLIWRSIVCAIAVDRPGRIPSINLVDSIRHIGGSKIFERGGGAASHKYFCLSYCLERRVATLKMTFFVQFFDQKKGGGGCKKISVRFARDS